MLGVSARSRWCLTGTPIQNTLMDLGALLAFMRIKPLDAHGAFRHWIMGPFEDHKTKQIAIHRLSLLLEAICIRRTIERVDIPRQQEETRVVHFTPEERHQYQETRKVMQRFIVQQAGEYRGVRSTVGMFQMYLQLRSFCNHGTYQRQFSWTRRNMVHEETDAICSIARDSVARCMGCRQHLPIIGPSSTSRFVEGCKHVFCDDCSQVTNGLQKNRHCPLCSSLGGISRSENTGDEAEGSDDSVFQPDGYSSKINMLVSDVQDSLDTTKRYLVPDPRRANQANCMQYYLFLLDKNTGPCRKTPENG